MWLCRYHLHMIKTYQGWQVQGQPRLSFSFAPETICLCKHEKIHTAHKCQNNIKFLVPCFGSLLPVSTVLYQLSPKKCSHGRHITSQENWSVCMIIIDTVSPLKSVHWKDHWKLVLAQLLTRCFVLCCPQSLPVRAPLLQDPGHGNLIRTQKTPQHLLPWKWCWHQLCQIQAGAYFAPSALTAQSFPLLRSSAGFYGKHFWILNLVLRREKTSTVPAAAVPPLALPRPNCHFALLPQGPEMWLNKRRGKRNIWKNGHTDLFSPLFLALQLLFEPAGSCSEPANHGIQ